MSTAKNILAIVVIFVLASCGISTPTAPPAPEPTATPAPKPTATPRPQDVPIYQNSFEGIADLAASGITSNGDVTLSTENFNYPGGGTALEIEGILPGEQNSDLHVDFSIKKLVGSESLDFTDKAISFSALLPVDSPFDNVSVYAGRIGQLTFIGGVNVDDEYWSKGEWHDYLFDLAKVQGLMKESDTIRIVGQRLTEGTASEAHFLVDNLSWIRSDRFNLPVDGSIDSLRKYAANKHFGFGLFSRDFAIFGIENHPYVNGDPWYAYMVAQESSINVIEDNRPKENEDYTNLDYDPVEDAWLLQKYRFGDTYGMSTLGYSIGSLYFNTPQWLKDLEFPDGTKALLLYHIEKSLRYTKGKEPVWILFNESIGGEGTGRYFLRNRQGYEGDYSPWAAGETDASLIKAAFIKAREVDPSATLILNDFEVEQIGLGKADFLYDFVSGLKSEDIPIDGVGFELHNAIDPDGNILWCRWVPGVYGNCTNVQFDMETYMKNVDLNVKRYAKLGIRVAFTEVEGQIELDDIDFNTPEGRTEYDQRLEWQAKYYAGLLKIALENENVIMFHTWGGTDRLNDGEVSPGYGNGYIFDANYDPKPAYDAMLELLKGQ